MDINDVIEGVNRAIPQLNTAPGTSKHDHVDRFQQALTSYLQSKVSDYNWYMETKMFGGKHGDRADIYGGHKSNSFILQNGVQINRIYPETKGRYFVCEKTCNDDWVIEIDAQRADQVAPKFLSRLALLGLSDKTIHYVAVLYEYTQSNAQSCIKYGKYAYEILHQINKKSTFDLIIVNQSSCDARLINLRRSAFEIKFNRKSIVEAPIVGMSEVAIKIVEDYIDRNTCITYAQLQDVFGKYVADAVVKSIYNKNNKSLVPTTVYTYTQWRNNYGTQHNWISFVKLCSDLGYSINKVF